MQEPSGLILNNCGGDVFKHGDNNRWTDNQRGTADDRLIQTKPAPAIGQFNFITAQALTAQLVQPTDPAYAKTCLEAAKRTLAYCQREQVGKGPAELGLLGAGEDRRGLRGLGGPPHDAPLVAHHNISWASRPPALQAVVALVNVLGLSVQEPH